MNQVCSGSSEEGTAILLEAVYFEQWVRFRWIAEEKDRFFIRIPEKDAALIREELPRFQTLLERLNDAEVNAEASFEAVLEYGRGSWGRHWPPWWHSPAFQERVAVFICGWADGLRNWKLPNFLLKHGNRWLWKPRDLKIFGPGSMPKFCRRSPEGGDHLGCMVR